MIGIFQWIHARNSSRRRVIFFNFACDSRLFDSQSDLEFSFTYAILKQVLVVWASILR